MCGRYVSASPPDQIAAYFDAVLSESAVEAPVEPSYNVAPTDDVYGVVDTPRGRELQVFRWGLVPAWADDVKVGQRMINARAEGIADKGAYRSSLRTKRCLVPADGFYEWRKVPGGTVPGRKAKEPLYIHRPDGEPLAFAGLWSAWRPKGSPSGTPWLHTATIVTVAANATLAPIHDRMPAVLPPSAWATWLDPLVQDPDEVTGLLVPAPDHLLTMHVVASDVGSVTSNGPHLIEPVAPESPEAVTEGRLFPDPA